MSVPSVACIDFAASGEEEERRLTHLQMDGRGRGIERRERSPDALFLTDFVHSMMASGFGDGRVPLLI